MKNTTTATNSLMTSWAFNSGERTKEGEGETLGPAVSEEEDEAEKSVVL